MGIAASGRIALSGSEVDRSIALEWGYSGGTAIDMNTAFGTWYDQILYGYVGATNANPITTPYSIAGYWSVTTYGSYIMGGIDSGSNYQSVTQKYIIYTNQWASNKYMAASGYHCAASNADKIWWQGGFDNTGTVRGYILKLDCFNESYTSTGGIRTSVYNLAASDPNKTHAIYAAGTPDSFDSSSLNSSTRLVWSTGAFTASGNLVTARNGGFGGCGSTSFGLLGAGWNTSSTIINTCERYTWTSYTWASTVALATARGLPAGSGAESTIGLIAGGIDASYNYLNSCERYTYSNGNKLTTTALSNACDGQGGTSAKGYAYFCGGLTAAATALSTTDRYTPTATNGAKTTVTALDVGVYSHSGAGSGQGY